MANIYMSPDPRAGIDMFRSTVTQEGEIDLVNRILDDRANAALLRINARWLRVMVGHRVFGTKMDVHLETATLLAHQRYIRDQGVKRLPKSVIPPIVPSKILEQADFLDSTAVTHDRKAEYYLGDLE